MSQKYLVVTHDGEFHGDDVVGVSLIKWIFKDIDIVRTREPGVIARADFVLDVGGQFIPEKCRFDHHQIDYKGELASAGMVLNWMEVEGHIENSLAKYLREAFILGVDQQDNGIYSPKPGICTYSDIISAYNVTSPNASMKDHDQAFMIALQFTVNLLERFKEKFMLKESVREKFEASLQQLAMMPSHCLVLDESLPWKEFVFESDKLDQILFVIFPISHEKWMLHTVPVSREEPYSSRQLLPSEWAGLLEGEFVNVCGIEGAIFCHKQRFIAAFKNKESAIRAVRQILKIRS